MKKLTDRRDHRLRRLRGPVKQAVDADLIFRSYIDLSVCDRRYGKFYCRSGSVTRRVLVTRIKKVGNVVRVVGVENLWSLGSESVASDAPDNSVRRAI